MIELSNIQHLFKKKNEELRQNRTIHNMNPKCSECNTVAIPKGSIEVDCPEGTVVLYQCPKCKNVDMIWKEHNHELRMTYP